MVHSSVVACQGFSSLASFRTTVYVEVEKKYKLGVTVQNTAMLMNTCTNAAAFRNSTCTWDIEVSAADGHQTQEVHRHEDGIDADKRQPEVNFFDPFILRTARTSSGSQKYIAANIPEDCGDTHDQVKVGDHEVPVVQV